MVQQVNCGDYMAKKKRTAKQKAATRRLVARNKKGGKRRKATKKKGGVRRTARRARKKFTARVKAQGLVSLGNDGVALTIASALPLKRLGEVLDGTSTPHGFMQAMLRDYFGVEIANVGGGSGGSLEATFDIKKAVGAKHLLTAFIYRKGQGLVNKYAPIRGFGKQGMGSLASSAMGKTIAEVPTFIAFNDASNASSGNKLVTFAESMSRKYTGLHHDVSSGGYQQFSKGDLLTGAISLGGGIAIKKGFGMVTKNMKFKLSRLKL